MKGHLAIVPVFSSEFGIQGGKRKKNKCYFADDVLSDSNPFCVVFSSHLFQNLLNCPHPSPAASMTWHTMTQAPSAAAGRAWSR